jgi:hypothetical protein
MDADGIYLRIPIDTQESYLEHLQVCVDRFVKFAVCRMLPDQIPSTKERRLSSHDTRDVKRALRRHV